MNAATLTGYAVLRPSLCVGIAVDEGEPETLMDRVLSVAFSTVVGGVGLGLVVIAAIANPEIFAATFGASFGVALVSVLRRG